jgi:hypothetical protein
MMNNENKNTANGTTSGISFCGLLTIVFIVLKLLGVISWSWLWVLAPLWIPLAIAVGIVIITYIITSIIKFVRR